MNSSLSVSIHIPKPCTAAWDEMQPENNGRFCQQCEQKVIDFSGMSDSEILRIISRAGAGSCGRFETSQLDRLFTPQAQPSRPVFPTALFVTLLGMTASVAGKGQPEIHMTAAATYPSAVFPMCIDGRVMDAATGEGLRGVTIMLKGSTIGTISDQTGYFRLTIEDAAFCGVPVFTVSCIGYDAVTFTTDSSCTQPFTFYLNKALNNLKEINVVGFATTPGTYTTGAYTIVARTARRENWWQRLAYIFRKKETLTPDLNKTL